MGYKKGLLTAMTCVIVMGLTACGGGSDDAADRFKPIDPVTMTEGVEEGSSDTGEHNTAEMQNVVEVQDVTEAQGTELPSDGQQGAQEQEAPDSEEELEEKLAVYRQVREDTEPVSLGNGVTMGGHVDPDKYGLLFDTSIFGILDTREMMEAIDTANSYVENTLGITVETRNTTYMCVDPRIWEIYSAEDKGVANGYEPENIYLREYCDNGIWQYLILVRDGKGSAWKVIHHGSSYME